MRFAFLVFFLVACVPKRSACEVWTLPSLLERAERVSPAVSAASDEVSAAAGDRRQAGLYSNPAVSVEDAIDWKYSLTEAIELPPAREARLSVFDRRKAEAVLAFERARLEVRTRVESLAYQLLAVRRRMSLLEDNMRLLSRLRATLPERYKPGLRSGAETLRVDLEAASARNELSRAKAEEVGARARLNAFLLQPSSAPLELQGRLEPDFVDLDARVLADRALRDDLALRLAEAGAEEQEAVLSAAKARRWPTLDAGPNLSRPRDAMGVLLGGFQAGLSLPLWDWRQGDVDAARARRSGARASAENQRLLLSADLEGLVEEYLSAKERAQALARQGVLEQAVKMRAQVLLAYQQGLFSLTDALDAMRTSTQVQQDYIQSLLDGRQALIGLEAHLGGPL